MKTCYYVILYRPQGSKTWTPLEMRWRLAGNFFATARKAKNLVKKEYLRNFGTYLSNLKKYVPNEYAIGTVSVNPDEPFLTSKLSSHE